MAKLAAKWRGPAKIKKQLNKVNYVVAMVDHPDQCDIYHVEKLKWFCGTVSPSIGGGDKRLTNVLSCRMRAQHLRSLFTEYALLQNRKRK